MAEMIVVVMSWAVTMPKTFLIKPVDTEIYVCCKLLFSSSLLIRDEMERKKK